MNNAMTEPWWDDVEEDPIHAQAAEWLTRLENPQVSLEETLNWQLWMQADQRHAQAFERIERTARTLRELPRAAVAAPAEPQRFTRRFTRHLVPLAMAASLAVAAVGGYWLIDFVDRDSGTDIISTAIGENRSLRLDDGSRITLGGGTELRVAFNDTSRRIELHHGEALFAVEKDAARPFTVTAGDARIRAVGTEFNVLRGRDRVVVAVVEGRVMVEPLAVQISEKVSSASVQLDAGQQTIVDEAGISAASQLANLDTATAWRSGRLTFRGEPLRHVVEDVNRYAGKPVQIEEPAIGELRFTGTVHSDNVSGWIASLEKAFGVQASEDRNRIVLRLAAAPL